jgi:integrase
MPSAQPEIKAPRNFHALRHAAASLFIEQGWTPKKVQTAMGHSSIQVTFDIYGHLFPTPDDDASLGSERLRALSAEATEIDVQIAALCASLGDGRK